MKKQEIFDKMGEYEFSQSELSQMATDIVRNNLQIEATYQEIDVYKLRMKEAKASIVSMGADSVAKSHKIKNGKERRLIACVLVRDFESKMRKFYSVDSGELICEEVFMREDFQLEIPFQEPEGKAEVVNDDPVAIALAEAMKNPHFAAGFQAYQSAKESEVETANMPELGEADLEEWKRGFISARDGFQILETAPAEDRKIEADMENPHFLAGYEKAKEVGWEKGKAFDCWEHCPEEIKADGGAAAKYADGWGFAWNEHLQSLGADLEGPAKEKPAAQKKKRPSRSKAAQQKNGEPQKPKKKGDGNGKK